MGLGTHEQGPIVLYTHRRLSATIWTILRTVQHNESYNVTHYVTYICYIVTHIQTEGRHGLTPSTNAASA